MEATIRYVSIDNGGVKPALVFRGRTKAHCVINDELSIRVVETELREVDKARPVPYRGGEYPLDLFLKRFHEIRQRKGITEEAKKFLVMAAYGTGQAPEDPVPPVDTPDKPPSTASARLAGDIGPSLIASMAIELGLTPAQARKRLRAAGMSAPYTNPDSIRKALQCS